MLLSHVVYGFVPVPARKKEGASLHHLVVRHMRVSVCASGLCLQQLSRMAQDLELGG